jgi:PTH2 family peptidyl-tRNA hydrolase
MIKMVIVMRTDLGMRKGKMIAQGAHAAIGAYLSDPSQCFIDEWQKTGTTKICVGVDSEAELLELYEKAGDSIARHLVRDKGITEFHGVPTYTCFALGPAPSEQIDPITGHLKLL